MFFHIKRDFKLVRSPLMMLAALLLFATESVGHGNHTSDSSSGTDSTHVQAIEETQDTVVLQEESQPRHVIGLDRNTRGLEENKGKYGVMALISLVVAGVIGFLIFRSRE